MIAICIVGYLLLGAITAAVSSYIDDDDITNDDGYILIIFLWPLYVMLMAILGIGIGLSKLAVVIRNLIAKFINWLRSDEK